MFPKAWQAITFVGFVLIVVVFAFGGDGQPAGVATAVEAAERNAAERAEEEQAAQAPQAPRPASTIAPQADAFGQEPAEGFADYQIEEYGAPQASAAPTASTSPWASSNPSGVREPRQDEILPQGPPPPGPRDPSMAPPRVIPHAPSEDPSLRADLRAAIDRASQ